MTGSSRLLEKRFVFKFYNQGYLRYSGFSAFFLPLNIVSQLSACSAGSNILSILMALQCFVVWIRHNFFIIIRGWICWSFLIFYFLKNDAPTKILSAHLVARVCTSLLTVYQRESSRLVESVALTLRETPKLISQTAASVGGRQALGVLRLFNVDFLFAAQRRLFHFSFT